MTLKIVRGVFILACIIMGAIWADALITNMESTSKETINHLPWVILGGFSGAAVATLILLVMYLITQDIYEKLGPVVVSVVLAMGMGYLLGQYIMYWWPDAPVGIRVNVIVTLVLLFGFVGISIGLTRASNWKSLMSAVSKRHPHYVGPKVVDSSVFIDGRIADIWKTGFIEGTLIVPRFILKELQRIADSPEVLRRAKGRRGLDIVKKLQESEMGASIVIVDDDPIEIPEVDSKLVHLSREYGARIITNDYNLNKMAQIEGVLVLNVNDLANALKPAVLPDDRLGLRIIKEGKEAFQGVGYLDDGTMVVVDGARDFVGKDVEVMVTSVLQTAAGRMIFSKLGHVLS